MTVLVGFLPWILILPFGFSFSGECRQAEAVQRGIFNFGKSKAKLISESAIKGYI